MNTTDNLAYSALRVVDESAYTIPSRAKTTMRQTKKRMSVEEYFGKVLRKLDEHYAAVQESGD